MYLYFNPVDGGAVLHPMYPGGPSPGVSTRGPSLDATFNVYGYLCIFPPHFPYIALLVCFSILVPFLSPLWVPVWLQEPTGFDWSWGPSQCVGSLRMCMPEVLDEITHCDRALDTTQY